MKPFSYQEELSDVALDIIKNYGLVYLGLEERCGKTLTAILTVEKSVAERCLVVTKKKAISGWTDTLAAYKHTKHYEVINYESLHKVTGKYDVVIADEAHVIAGYPKVGQACKRLQKIAYKLPVIFLSATPFAQGYQQLFNQLAITRYSPFDSYKNFYEWHRRWGIADKVRTSYGLQETYKRCKPDVFKLVKHLFVFKTRAELGFDHEPEDIIHMVELSDVTKKLYNDCMVDEMLQEEIPLDSSMKLRTTLHQIEGGFYTDEDSFIEFGNTEKIEDIRDEFGDGENCVIMANYRAEQHFLPEFFPKALVVSATSNAEGVDYSMYEHLIIYSQNFSTSKHSQRRARQANKNRTTPIKVHFYLVKGAISEQVFDTVSVNKTNFIDRFFSKEKI